MLKQLTGLLLIAALCIAGSDGFSNNAARAGESRGLRVSLTAPGNDEEKIVLYEKSYALLVGVSRYNAGWPQLESIPGEIDLVRDFFQEHGFEVTTVMDPDGATLRKSFKEFINAYGLEKENRLLFFFSGHGYTRNNGKKGYLVPTDAPDPGIDLTGFLKKSLGMNQVLSWARDIESKHALFIFDSCFSGTIFKQKSQSPPPRHITRLTVEPVRQFITAGSAGEKVPANSIFTPALIDGLRFGLADLNKDGYVSGTELGLYLQAEVPQYTEQNPQYGKINDYDLSRGDFIFMTDSTLAKEPPARDNRAPANFSTLSVTTDPAGAELFIDGNLLGKTPLVLSRITPGDHVLKTGKPGYRTDYRQIQILAEKQVSLSFSMVPLSTDGIQKQQDPPSPQTPNGYLTVSTNPGGTMIEIVELGTPYRDGMAVPPGTYNLIISKQGYETSRRKIRIRENQKMQVNFLLRKQAESQNSARDQGINSGRSNSTISF
jgi:hypothetical protein